MNVAWHRAYLYLVLEETSDYAQTLTLDKSYNTHVLNFLKKLPENTNQRLSRL